MGEMCDDLVANRASKKILTGKLYVSYSKVWSEQWRWRY